LFNFDEFVIFGVEGMEQIEDLEEAGGGGTY
jgi:hypothetical protein